MIVRIDRVVQTAQGQAIAGAQVYFLTQPADPETLTPLANVYSDLTGTPATNPQITDGLGQVGCYLDNGQLYTIVVVSPPQLVTQVYPDQNLNSTTSSGPTPFGQVPVGTINGTNRVFTLPVTPVQLTVWLNQPLIPGLGFTAGVISGVFTITFARAPQPASGGVAADAIWAQGYF